MDITQLILDDHQEQRRLFSILEQVGAHEVDALTAIWTQLASFLELHAEAEERLFYPALLRVGRGAGGKSDAEDETEHAIRDHNKLRDALAAAKPHRIGSEEWLEAIARVNKENGDHMAEEEREGLTDFRLTADVELRHELAVSFAAFSASHASGVRSTQKDPERYVAANRPPRPDVSAARSTPGSAS